MSSLSEIRVCDTSASAVAQDCPIPSVLSLMELGCNLIEQAAGTGTLQAECMTCHNANGWAQGATRSAHPGGVHVCMVDSSVHFISDEIETGDPIGVSDGNDLFAWQRLNASQDGQIIDTNEL